MPIVPPGTSFTQKCPRLDDKCCGHPTQESLQGRERKVTKSGSFHPFASFGLLILLPLTLHACLKRLHFPLALPSSCPLPQERAPPHPTDHPG